MDIRSLFGREEELALAAPADLVGAIVEEAAARHPHALSPPPGRRYFLANGGCLYEDLGHAELATAECSDPVELAAHTLALRQMLAEAAEAVGRVYGLPVRVVANNIDYGLGGSHSYGHHLSLLVRGTPLERIVAQLAPLLAAMPLVSGAGKISFAPGACGFELSQRSAHFTSLLSAKTVNNRGMVTAKDEALCTNGVRLHLISLDTVRSPCQLVLVPAILALCAKAVEAGKDLAGPVTLADPVCAFQQVSCDVLLKKAELPLQSGGSTTALDIHDHYLAAVEGFLATAPAPPWASPMVDLWRQVVSNLRTDMFAEAGRIDWVTKLVMFTRSLTLMGMDWREFSRWKFTLASVRRLKATWPELDPVTLASSAAARARIRHSALGILEHHFAQQGLSWADFPRFWNAANWLCDQCVQYHTLVPGENLSPVTDASGLVTMEMVNRASRSPPVETRARVRGKAISEAGPGATAGWDFLQEGDRRLEMPDAFGEGAEWRQTKRSADKEARQ